MPANGHEERSGRETRLLILVVAVSLAVLLLLARFRFPAADLTTVTPSAAPLAGLAARASFEEMTDIIRGALNRVSPVVVVVPMSPIPEPPPERPRTGRRGAPPPAEPPTVDPSGPRQFVPALRLKNDLALVHLPAGYRFVPVGDGGEPPQVIGGDQSRQVALIRVPTGTSVEALPGGLRTSDELTFALVVSATPQGTTASPVFIGRADSIPDPNWPVRLTALGGPADFPVGALVFSLQGSFLGLVTRHDAGVAMVPAVAIGPLLAQLTPQGGAE